MKPAGLFPRLMILKPSSLTAGPVKKEDPTDSNGDAPILTTKVQNLFAIVPIPVPINLPAECSIRLPVKIGECIPELFVIQTNGYQNNKIRVNVEKNIQYFKDPMGCGNPKTRDNLTIKADLLLVGYYTDAYGSGPVSSAARPRILTGTAVFASSVFFSLFSCSAVGAANAEGFCMPNLLTLLIPVA